jgi:hypothetical protein
MGLPKKRQRGWNRKNTVSMRRKQRPLKDAEGPESTEAVQQATHIWEVSLEGKFPVGEGLGSACARESQKRERAGARSALVRQTGGDPLFAIPALLPVFYLPRALPAPAILLCRRRCVQERTCGALTSAKSARRATSPALKSVLLVGSGLRWLYSRCAVYAWRRPMRGKVVTEDCGAITAFRLKNEPPEEVSPRSPLAKPLEARRSSPSQAGGAYI